VNLPCLVVSASGSLSRLLRVFGGAAPAPWRILLGAVWLAGWPVGAHDSPEHVIEGLTARIEAEPRRADLFWRRAVEHRVLGQLSAASRDLRQALRLQQDYLPALTELSRVQLAQGHRREALAVVNRALSLVPDEAGRAPLRMVRAEVRGQAGDWQGALADCNAALTNATGVAELDWYLTRSQFQCRLGQFAAAAAGLQEGFERTGSAVLEVESIDALIDGGFFAEAAGKIEPLLEECRWQANWLIRRARVRLGQGEVCAGQTDLLAAIQELNSRLSGAHPDAGLLANRGLAYALLGDAGPARRDLDAARKLGADDESLRRLTLALHPAN